MYPTEFVEARKTLRLTRAELSEKLGYPVWRINLIEKKARSKAEKEIMPLIGFAMSYLMTIWESPKTLRLIRKNKKETLTVYKHGPGLHAEYLFSHYYSDDVDKNIVLIKCPVGNVKEADEKRQNQNVCVNYAEALPIHLMITYSDIFDISNTIFVLQNLNEGLHDISIPRGDYEEDIDWESSKAIDAVRVAKRIVGLKYANGERRVLDSWISDALKIAQTAKDIDTSLLASETSESTVDAEEVGIEEVDPVAQKMIEITGEFEVVEWHYCSNLGKSTSNPWVPFVVACTRDDQYFVICLDNRRDILDNYKSLLFSVAHPSGMDPAMFNNEDSAWDLVEMIVSQTWPNINYDDIRGEVEASDQAL